LIIDANVILIYLLRNNEGFYERSANLLDDIFLGKKKILILHSVLAEVAYVLQKFYKIDNKEIEKFLTEFLGMETIKAHDKEVVLEALKIFGSKKLDFMGCILCAYSKDHVIIAFDGKVNDCIRKWWCYISLCIR